MNIKKALVFGLVTVSLLWVIAVYAKNEEQSKWKKTVSLEEYNRKTEVNILTMDLHERVKKEWIKILENLSWLELPTDDVAKRDVLSFLSKRKKLRDLHAQAAPAYEKAQSLEQTDKKWAIKSYDEALNTFKKWKATISEDVYVMLDMANIQKQKANLYKDLKDFKNQETSLQEAVNTYDQAIASYKKNPKSYDNWSDTDLHIGKTLQYEKWAILEDLVNFKKTKTDKKKILLQAFESYKGMLKYNTIDNCDAGCVIVDSAKIKDIYMKLKSL